MGTSKSYSAPGSWGPLKTEVTRAARAADTPRGTAGHIVGHFVQQNGGSAAMARGRNGGVIGGAAGRAVAQRLGAFIATVGEVGFAEALRRQGLGDLVGRSVQEILAALLDRLGGPASTIDDVDARTALARLQEEQLEEATDAEQVEQILLGRVDDLEDLLARYFGLYLYEQFCRVFFERLVQRVGESKALSFLNDIREFILASITNRLIAKPARTIDWAGKEGAAFCSAVMQSTLEVFTG